MVDPQRTEQEQSTARRANIIGMSYTDGSRIESKLLYKAILSIPEIRQLRVIPLTADRNHIKFGVTTTTSQKTMQQLNARFQDQQVSFTIVSDATFRDYMLLYDPPRKIEYQDIAITKQTDSATLAQISATLQQVSANDMLAYIVQQAFRLNASDIHLESRINGARIRFRVHGVLHPIALLDGNKYRQLMGVLASAANISTSARYDQTGHINQDFKMATGEMVNVNLRVETVPAVNGIDGVLRIFNFSGDMMRLDKLGLDTKQETVIRDVISRPSGLVMIVGPTGSGKTTTLYSILNELNNDEHKIITLEDPVEYQIEGITQIPVVTREGESFADKFRAVMRLDPDVIMVGEIRDLDTAKTALQAALTGHLVLATYHASSAAAALTRLLDAIGENPVYASAIRLIQSQRLVRRLDKATMEKIIAAPELEAHIESIVTSIKTDVDLSWLPQASLYKPGASTENPFGFDGQIAIRELMTMTPGLQKLLMRPKVEITTEAIEAVAVESGMITMKQDGTLKALKGETTFEEITRTVG
jgi:type II secretory ATPase GspE/PulE/Tfp pilus assembly ATPase PilB-like protein